MIRNVQLPMYVLYISTAFPLSNPSNDYGDPTVEGFTITILFDDELAFSTHVVNLLLLMILSYYLLSIEHKLLCC